MFEILRGIFKGTGDGDADNVGMTPQERARALNNIEKARQKEYKVVSDMESRIYYGQIEDPESGLTDNAFTTKAQAEAKIARLNAAADLLQRGLEADMQGIERVNLSGELPPPRIQGLSEGKVSGKQSRPGTNQGGNGSDVWDQYSQQDLQGWKNFKG